MSSPIHHRLSLAAFLKKLLWALFIIVMIAVGLDVVLSYDYRLARGAMLGATLSFVMQLTFTLLSYRGYNKSHHNGVFVDTRPPNKMLSDMTLALLCKWIVAFIGFAIIFKLPYTLSIPAVFAGFLLMQFVNLAALFFVKRF